MLQSIPTITTVITPRPPPPLPSTLLARLLTQSGDPFTGTYTYTYLAGGGGDADYWLEKGGRESVDVVVA